MVAERCGVGSRRTISSVKLEDSRQRTAHATEYVVKAEDELPEVRDGILEVMDEDLISLTSTGGLMAQNSKMTGDYYRYAERVMATPVPQPVEEIMEVIRLVPQEHILEHVVEEIHVPVPRGMEEQASKLDGTCAAQAPEWKELRGLRDEELVTIRDINKLLNDSDEFIPKWFNVVKGIVEMVPLTEDEDEDEDEETERKRRRGRGRGNGKEENTDMVPKHFCSCADHYRDHNQLPEPRSKQALSKRTTAEQEQQHERRRQKQ